MFFWEHSLWFTFLSKCVWPFMFFLEPWLWFTFLSKCAWLTMVNILVKWYLAHIISWCFFWNIDQNPLCLSHNKNPFHCNPIWLSMIDHKLVRNPHYMYNIKFYAYHYIHETSNNILKWGSPHYSKCASLWRPISCENLQLVMKGVCIGLLSNIPNCFNILFM
jgi:hypothetical protein